jgi:hypothetical protein
MAVAGIALNGALALALASAAGLLSARLRDSRERGSDAFLAFWLVAALLFASIGLRQLAGAVVEVERSLRAAGHAYDLLRQLAGAVARADRYLFLASILLQGLLSAPVAAYALPFLGEGRDKGPLGSLPLALSLAAAAACLAAWWGGLGVYTIGAWGTDWYVNDRQAFAALTLVGLVPGLVLALLLPALSFGAKSRLTMYRLATSAVSFLLGLSAAYVEVTSRASPWLLLPRAALGAAVALAAIGHFPPPEVRRELH